LSEINPKVAYIITAVNSEFILREMQEMANQGIEMYIFALRKKPHGLEIEFPGINQLPRPVFYKPFFFSPRILWAQCYFLFTAPLKYLSALIKIFVVSKNITFTIKGIAIFPKSVYYAKIMKEHSISYIHSHWATTSTTSAMIISRLLGIDFGFTGHAWDIRVDTHALTQKMKQAKYIITCTKYNQRYLAGLCKEFDPTKIRVSYHGLNPLNYIPLANKNNTKFKILSVGKLAEKKGFNYLLEALYLLKEEGLDFTGDIFGWDGPQKEEILDLHAKYKLGDRVKINGYIPHPELIERMKEADIFVLPCVRQKDSHQDGLPNVLIESLAVGVPVISTDISGIPELVINMETGILIRPRDVHSLVRAIKTLYLDPELRQRLGRKGRQKILEEFDVKKNVTKLIEIMTS
jgi:glycosyltransferase involved in cell wall biosynthesis